jgi:hypothetical protein
MKTRQELIAATLKKLNVIGAGQAPEPEDVQEIEDNIDGKISELNANQIFYFSDRQNFEEECVDPLAIILADQAAPSFGQPSNAESRILAENRLRSLRNSSWQREDVIPSLYF